ncbi:MAG: MFS transporter [Chloroflexi bacterium]|nr:MFS transporter [Chloroflexota bacterium]
MLAKLFLTLPQRRPKIFFGWYIVAASVGMNFYLSLAFFQGFQIFFLPIVNEFGWSRTLTSGAFALRQLETGVMAPAVGFLVDRWGPRTIILGGVIVGGTGMLLLSAISSAWMFYLAFAIISFGVSGASHGIAWPAVIVKWFHRMRGRALGLAMLGPVVAGPFLILVQLLEEALGWRLAIFVLGVGLWVLGIPLALLARPHPEVYGLLADGEPVAAAKPPVQGKAHEERRDRQDLPGLTVAEAVRTRAFWALVAVFGIHGLGVSGVMVHQVPLFQSVGFSPREASIGLGLVFFLSGIGRLSAGVLMDLIDQRLVLTGALVAQALSFLLLAYLTEWWQVIPFALLFGIAFGSTIPARPILMGRIFGQRAFGALQGLVQGAAVATGVLGPLIMGLAFDLTGTYAPANFFFAVLTLAAAPLALLVPSSQASA